MADTDIAEAFGAADSRDQRFAVYIPNKDKDGNAVAEQQWILEALNLLSSICGGRTAIPPIRGAWLNEASGNLAIKFNQTFYLIDIA